MKTSRLSSRNADCSMSLKRRVLTIWYFHVFCLLIVRRDGMIQSS